MNKEDLLDIVNELVDDALLLARDDPVGTFWVVATDDTRESNAMKNFVDPNATVVSTIFSPTSASPKQFHCSGRHSPKDTTNSQQQGVQNDGDLLRSMIVGELCQDSFDIAYRPMKKCTQAFLVAEQQKNYNVHEGLHSRDTNNNELKVLRCLTGGVKVFLEDDLGVRTAFPVSDPSLVASPASSSSSSPTTTRRGNTAPKLYARECLVELPLNNWTSLLKGESVQEEEAKDEESVVRCFLPPSQLPISQRREPSEKKVTTNGRTAVIPHWLVMVLPAVADPRDGFLSLPEIFGTLQLLNKATRSLLWSLRPHAAFDILAHRVQYETPTVWSRANFTSTAFQRQHSSLAQFVSVSSASPVQFGKAAKEVLTRLYQLISSRGLSVVENHIIETEAVLEEEEDGHPFSRQVDHTLTLADCLLISPRHLSGSSHGERWALQAQYIFSKLGSKGWYMTLENLHSTIAVGGPSKNTKVSSACGRWGKQPQTVRDAARIPSVVHTLLEDTVKQFAAKKKNDKIDTCTSGKEIAELSSEKTISSTMFVQVRLWTRPYYQASMSDEGLSFVEGRGFDGLHSYPGCDEEVHFHRFVVELPIMVASGCAPSSTDTADETQNIGSLVAEEENSVLTGFAALLDSTVDDEEEEEEDAEEYEQDEEEEWDDDGYDDDGEYDDEEEFEEEEMEVGGVELLADAIHSRVQQELGLATAGTVHYRVM